MAERIKSAYYEPEPGEWIMPNMQDYKLACCDCGLVHRINLKVVRRPGGYRVKWQIFRDNRATAMMRRWRKKRGEHVPA